MKLIGNLFGVCDEINDLNYVSLLRDRTCVELEWLESLPKKLHLVVANELPVCLENRIIVLHRDLAPHLGNEIIPRPIR